LHFLNSISCDPAGIDESRDFVPGMKDFTGTVAQTKLLCSLFVNK
jgi:hypothetical protein